VVDRGQGDLKNIFVLLRGGWGEHEEVKVLEFPRREAGRGPFLKLVHGGGAGWGL